MRSNFLILVLICILNNPLTSIGQNFNESIEGITTGIKRGGYITELQDQSILISTYPYSIRQTEIIKLDKNGTLLNKRDIDCYITGLLAINTDSVILIGCYNIDSTKMNLVVMILDEDLDIIGTDSIIIDCPILYTARIIFHNNQFYYIGSFQKSFYQFVSYVTAGTINKKGKFEKRTDFIISNTDVSHLQGNPNGDILIFQAGSLIYTFDKDLNYKSYFLFQDSDIICHADSFWANDSVFLMSGTTLIDDKCQFKIRKTDKNYNVKKIVVNKNDNIFDYAGVFSNLVKTSNDFYFVGTKNANRFGLPIDYKLSTISVIKYDFNLNKIWEKEIGGDAFYMVYSVAPTEDNGILILSTRYDSLVNGQNDNDLFLIKMDADGNYSEIDLNEALKDNFAIYPNPGTNNIEIISKMPIENTVFRLYEISGEIVLNQNIKGRSIPVNGIKPGIYIYTISSQNKIIQSGRWVKQ